MLTHGTRTVRGPTRARPWDLEGAGRGMTRVRMTGVARGTVGRYACCTHTEEELAGDDHRCSRRTAVAWDHNAPGRPGAVCAIAAASTVVVRSRSSPCSSASFRPSCPCVADGDAAAAAATQVSVVSSTSAAPSHAPRRARPLCMPLVAPTATPCHTHRAGQHRR